jgi:hypothetical protein
VSCVDCVYCLLHIYGLRLEAFSRLVAINLQDDSRSRRYPIFRCCFGTLTGECEFIWLALGTYLLGMQDAVIPSAAEKAQHFNQRLDDVTYIYVAVTPKGQPGISAGSDGKTTLQLHDGKVISDTKGKVLAWNSNS